MGLRLATVLLLRFLLQYPPTQKAALHGLASWGLVVRGLAALLFAAWFVAPSKGVAQEVPGGVLPLGAAVEILRVHNAERAAVGVAPLRWDDSLASTARQCVNRLAARREFRHCANNENLWMGSADRFGPVQIAMLWANERRHFKNGIFPNVSSSGKWQDVGHYTAMVWSTTTTVGCAAATGADGLTRLACHYAPPPNIAGQPVFSASSPQPSP